MEYRPMKRRDDRSLHLLVPFLLVFTSLGWAGEPDRLDNYTDWGIYRGDKKGNQFASRFGVVGGPSPVALTIPSAPEWLFARETGQACRLEWKANPLDIDDEEQFTALMFAAAEGHADVVRCPRVIVRQSAQPFQVAV